MSRIDVVRDDLSGVYVDDEWVPTENVKIDYHAEAESIYTLGDANPTYVYQPRVEVTLSAVNREYTMERFSDPELVIWTTRQEYSDAHPYVIDEVPTLI